MCRANDSLQTPATVRPWRHQLENVGVCAVDLPTVGAVVQQQVKLRVPPRKGGRVEVVEKAAVA